MQDRFKFRAKLKDKDKWIYGAYLKMLPYQPYPVGNVKPLKTEYKHLIIVEGSADWGMPRGIAAYEVIPETVGQCTGLKDKNGILIYEGDIVRTDDNIILLTKIHSKIDMDYGRVEFIRDFGFKFPLTYIPLIANEVEVIGNIYENPELLEDKR